MAVSSINFKCVSSKNKDFSLITPTTPFWFWLLCLLSTQKAIWVIGQVRIKIWGLLWWSSGEYFTFQCRRHGFNFWSKSALQQKKKNPENRGNIVTNSIRAFKMVHLKKKKRIKIHVTWTTTQRKLSNKSMPYFFHSLRHVSKMGDECPVKSHYQFLSTHK